MKIFFDVSTGCLHFEIYQEDTRRVSVVRGKKKKLIGIGYFSWVLKFGVQSSLYIRTLKKQNLKHVKFKNFSAKPSFFIPV